MIGVGSISDKHAQGFRESEIAKVVAVADSDAALAKAKAEKFGASMVFDSAEKLLRRDDIDAVDICIPNYLHSAVAISACEAGKHVLLEKPMARNVKECDEIIRAAEKASVNLMVNHMLMFFPPFTLSKKLVSGGEIGRIFRMRSRRTWASDIVDGELTQNLLVEGS